MHQRSSIPFCKWLSGRPLQRSVISTSPFPFKSLTNLSSQCVSDSVSPPNPKRIHHFLHPNSSNPSTLFTTSQSLRKYSVDTSKEVDEINLKFAEARDEIEMALESKETVYFDEEAECARAAVKEVLEMFEGLLSKLPENEKAAIQRSMGLKIEQLKAELEQLNE